MIDLREVDPVPRHRSEGWARSAEGIAIRARIGGAATVATAPASNRPRRVRTAALATAVVLGLVISLVVVQRVSRSGSPVASSTIERLARGHWTNPIATGLSNATAIWTGKELIVWGDDGQESKGISFDPRASRTARLPEWPLGVRSGALVRWTGKEMLVIGGFDIRTGAIVGGVDGAAYDPAARRWRLLAASPYPLSIPSTAIWTGRVLVVTTDAHQGSACSGPASCGAAVPRQQVVSYDPVSGLWKSLTTPPASPAVPPGGTLAAAWSGSEVAYVASDGSAVAYDPSFNGWGKLPDAPSYVSAGRFDLVRAGNGVTLLASEPGSPATLHALRVARGSWQWVPAAPAIAVQDSCPAGATSVPQGVAMACGSTAVLGLDRTSRRWVRLRPPPAGPHSLVAYRSSLAWGGDRLYVVTNGLLSALTPAKR